MTNTFFLIFFLDLNGDGVIATPLKPALRFYSGLQPMVGAVLPVAFVVGIVLQYTLCKSCRGVINSFPHTAELFAAENDPCVLLFDLTEQAYIGEIQGFGARLLLGGGSVGMCADKTLFTEPFASVTGA